MRALVTGAGGFVGSHMVDLLVNEGHRVTGLDINVAHRNRKANYISGSVLAFPSELWPDPDWIFHFAGLASIPPSLTNPGIYAMVNTQGTVELLELIRRKDRAIKKVVYAASSSCYGDHPPQPTPETAPIDCRTPYALTKWMGEEVILHWGKRYGIPVMSCRIFTAFGPRMRTDDGTGILLDQAKRKKPLTIRGTGEQFRDFVYVEDVCRAFLKAAETDVTGEVVNVGTGLPHTVNQLVEALGAEVTRVPTVEEPNGTHADPGKIKRLLGWEAMVPFSEGVRRSVA